MIRRTARGAWLDMTTVGFEMTNDDEQSDAERLRAAAG